MYPAILELLLEFHKPDSRETVPCNCLMNCVESNIVIEKIKVSESLRCLFTIIFIYYIHCASRLLREKC